MDFSVISQIRAPWCCDLLSFTALQLLVSSNGQRLGHDLFHVALMQPQHAVAATRKREVVSRNEGGELVVAM